MAAVGATTTAATTVAGMTVATTTGAMTAGMTVATTTGAMTAGMTVARTQKLVVVPVCIFVGLGMKLSLKDSLGMIRMK